MLESLYMYERKLPGWNVNITHEFESEYYNNPEKLGKFADFLEWRRIQLQAHPLITAEAAKIGVIIEPLDCYCFEGVSMAAIDHDIVGHVCEKHANQFGVFEGPIWQNDLSLATKLIEQRHALSSQNPLAEESTS